MRILLSEPGREGAWVASSDNDNLAIWLILQLDGQEVSEISECLFGVQVLKVLGLPGVKWLRLTIESMLNCKHESLVLSSKHEGEQSILSDAAGILSTDV